MAPVAGVPPLGLVLRRLIDTRDTIRFQRILDATEHIIVQLWISQPGEDYAEQCLQLWIDRTYTANSEVRRLYRQDFHKDMSRPVVADYDMGAVKRAIQGKLFPILDSVQTAVENIRAGVFVEMSKTVDETKNVDETKTADAAWVHAQVRASPVLLNIDRVFKPRQWYYCQ